MLNFCQVPIKPQVVHAALEVVKLLLSLWFLRQKVFNGVNKTKEPSPSHMQPNTSLKYVFIYS